jgi:hypothetical protein
VAAQVYQDDVVIGGQFGGERHQVRVIAHPAVQQQHRRPAAAVRHREPAAEAGHRQRGHPSALNWNGSERTTLATRVVQQ